MITDRVRDRAKLTAVELLQREQLTQAAQSFACQKE